MDENLLLDLPSQIQRIALLQKQSKDKERAQQAAAAASEPGRRLSTITERLTKKFGLGEDARKRRALYTKLEKLSEQHEDLLRDLISEAALAIEMGAYAEDVALTVHPHPTLGEAVMEAAKHALGEAVHIMNRPGTRTSAHPASLAERPELVAA